jgi:hypothetical protein
MNSDFEKLHESIPLGDIKSVKEKITKGNISGNIPSNPESLKLEINAMTSFVTEQAWQFFKNHIHANPGNFIKLDFLDREEKKITGKEITEKELIKCLNDPHLDAVSAGRILEDITTCTITEQINLWEGQKLKEKKNGNRDPVFERYQMLLISRDQKIKQPEEISPAIEIRRGINTAAETMWTVLGLIPSVYKRQYGKSISEEEYKIIAKRALSLVLQIAQLQVDVFAELRQTYISSEPEITKTRYLQDRSFKIIGEGDTLTLSLEDRVFEAAQKAKPRINLRTGCPAIFSHGSGGKNVIAEMYEWVLELNNKFFLPNLDKFNREI